MGEGDDIGQSRDPLFSDYERLGNLLTEAQNLGKENNQYNPAIIRKYFVVLAEIFRFMRPIVGGENIIVEELKADFKALDKITREAFMKLLTEKKYKVSVKIFFALSQLHEDVLVLKQNANLGVRLKETLSTRKKVERALE